MENTINLLERGVLSRSVSSREKDGKSIILRPNTIKNVGMSMCQGSIKECEGRGFENLNGGGSPLPWGIFRCLCPRYMQFSRAIVNRRYRMER